MLQMYEEDAMLYKRVLFLLGMIFIIFCFSLCSTPADATPSTAPVRYAEPNGVDCYVVENYYHNIAISCVKVK